LQPDVFKRGLNAFQGSIDRWLRDLRRRPIQKDDNGVVSNPEPADTASALDEMDIKVQ